MAELYVVIGEDMADRWTLKFRNLRKAWDHVRRSVPNRSRRSTTSCSRFRDVMKKEKPSMEEIEIALDMWNHHVEDSSSMATKWEIR